MNKLQTVFKAFTRMKACAMLLFTGPALLAQENTVSTDTTNNGDRTVWYDQGWLWFVIIIVAIILILSFTRKSDKTQDRYKDKR